METNILTKTINNMINQRLLDTHTNFIAKVVSININLFTIQPLYMYKIYGEKSKKSSIINDILCLSPYKYVYKVDKKTKEIIDIKKELIDIGDTVYCGVCERDITEAKKGNIALSSIGRHHNLSDSIVIMGLSSVEYVESGE